MAISWREQIEKYLSLKQQEHYNKNFLTESSWYVSGNIPTGTSIRLLFCSQFVFQKKWSLYLFFLLKDFLFTQWLSSVLFSPSGSLMEFLDIIFKHLRNFRFISKREKKKKIIIICFLYSHRKDALICLNCVSPRLVVVSFHNTLARARDYTWQPVAAVC